MYSKQGKNGICTAYGSYVLSTITNMIRDIEDGKIPDIVNDGPSL